MAVRTSQGWTLMFYGVLPCKNALRVAYSVLPRLLVAVSCLAYLSCSFVRLSNAPPVKLRSNCNADI
jgi:hypothetical protein